MILTVLNPDDNKIDRKDNNKYIDIIGDYINKEDIVRHNSNLVYSLPALNATLSGAVSKDYWLEKIYPNEALHLHNEGWIYIHNLDILGPYCSGYSAMDIAKKGLNSNSKNAYKTKAPKHIHSLLGQCSNFIALISQEIHGACAINDITSIVASYLFVERDLFGFTVTFQDLKNAIQHFIYEINLAFRAGNSAFSNITMSIGGPDLAIRDDYITYGGNFLVKESEHTSNGKNIKLDKHYTYKDVPLSFYDEVNRAFIEIIAEGDAEGKPFTFPLITVNIYDDTDMDNETFDYLLDECDKWGGIYLENYRTKPFEEDSPYKKANKYIQPRNPELQKSFCCRFQVSLEEIMKINSGIFKSGSGVGGIGVFNINLNRIGYVCQGNWLQYYEILDEIMEVLEASAQAKRKFIEDNKELYPYFFHYNESLDSYFNVLSVCGGHESLINMGIPNGLKCDEGINKSIILILTMYFFFIFSKCYERYSKIEKWILTRK